MNREAPLKRGECAYILSDVGVFPTNYCRIACRYTLIADGDKKVRVYAPFCVDHMKVAEKEANELEDY